MPVFLPKRVARLAELASQDATRSALTGVLIVPPPLPEDWWKLIATDGRVLAIVQGPNVVGDLQTSESLAGIAPEGPEAQGIISLEDWKSAFKLKDRLAHALGVALTAKEIAVALGKQSLKSLPVEGRFPDYRQVLPRRAPLLQIDVNPLLLAKLCQVAASLADKGEERLTLLYYGKDQPLGLMCKGDGGLTFDALLVPLT